VRAASGLLQPLLRSRRAGDCATYLIAFFLLLAWQQASAQLAPVEDFFNSGAQLYISNNVPAALERVEMGLKTYPDDEKLKKLEQLLKQQQQQQQQNQQQQNQQQQSQQDQKQQDKKDQQQKQDQQQDQQKNSEQPKPDEQKQSDQKKDEEQKPPEQKKASGDQPKDDQPEQQQAQPVKPGEMTPAEAKRLMDAQKGNEQLLQLKPENKPRDNSRPVKDW
jgi:Ca-activated chloride channel family protein